MSRSAQNRPFKYGDRDRREFIVRDCETALRVEYDGDQNPIYIGRARVGFGTDEPVWQISLQTFDANDNITAKQWPENDLGNPSSEYEFVWDDRAAYTYG